MVSYLKTLLIPFNEMVEKFLGQIQPLADGSTTVPMKVHFGEFTQDVISKVSLATLGINSYDVIIISAKQMHQIAVGCIWYGLHQTME